MREEFKMYAKDFVQDKYIMREEFKMYAKDFVQDKYFAFSGFENGEQVEGFFSLKDLFEAASEYNPSEIAIAISEDVGRLIKMSNNACEVFATNRDGLKSKAIVIVINEGKYNEDNPYF